MVGIKQVQNSIYFGKSEGSEKVLLMKVDLTTLDDEVVKETIQAQIDTPEHFKSLGFLDAWDEETTVLKNQRSETI